VNLETLKDRPAVSALPQWVRLDPERERMSLFGHDANMRRAVQLRKLEAAAGGMTSFGSKSLPTNQAASNANASNRA
jgi:hypothetical protein